MSTVIEPPATPKTPLVSEQSKEAIARRATKAVAQILNLCHTLEGIRDDFLPLLSELDDDTVIQVRMSARAIGVWSWVVECACDADMISRVEKRTGRKDESATRDGFAEEGRESAKRQQAYLDGKSTRTVERNVQIFNTFGLETLVKHGETLQDKGFWIAALSAPDPIEAVETFAEVKADKPFWEVKDAYREIDRIKGAYKEIKEKFVEAIGGEQRKAMADWLFFDARPTIQKLRERCPNPRLAAALKEIDTQLEEQHDVLFIETAEEALLHAYARGHRTEEQMEQITFLPHSEVRRVMLNLQEDGYFVEQPQQWKPDKAKGGRCKEWKRTDKPMPSITIIPPTENGRAIPVTG